VETSLWWVWYIHNAITALPALDLIVLHTRITPE